MNAVDLSRIAAGAVVDTTRAADAATASGTEAAASILLIGPRALAEIPVAIGEQLDLHHVNFSSPLYGSLYEVVLERAGQVLLFHQGGGPNTDVPGFTLNVGAPICGRPFYGQCGDEYRNELAVTVPGGATGTLATGQTLTIGDYQVTHGATIDLEQRSEDGEGCPADAFASGNSITVTNITAVLLPPSG